MLKLLFVVNVDWFFISHRLILAKSAIKEGYDVTVACKDTGRKAEIEAVGAKFINFEFERSGTNPLKELKTLLKFYQLYRKLKPDAVHHITLKPITYGSIVSRILGVPTLNAVSGLGFNFTEDKKGFSTKLMTAMMTFGFKNKNLVCIFQNDDDKETVYKRGIINDLTKVVKIKGAGVNLEEFAYSLPEDKDKLTVILPARLLWDKGVKEFHDAAKMIKHKYYGKIEFKLIGFADTDNKAGVSEEELQKWIDPGYFTRIEYQTNMVPIYTESDIVVLPSYREGMPKTLLEACSVGRPIITTDAIGCRECVDEGVNGYKVPIKDSVLLADRISNLVDDKSLMLKMGENSRKKAELEFNVDDVINKHLEIYKLLSGGIENTLPKAENK